jgi:tetratricopeptide (TPR) repeat protein
LAAVREALINVISRASEHTLQRANALIEKGEFALAEDMFRDAIGAEPFNRVLLLQYALMKRLADERDEATQILDHMDKLFDRDEEELSVRAQIDLERGVDATGLFDKLVTGDPNNLRHYLGLIAAIAATGDTDLAISKLEARVAEAKGWIEGLNILSKLRWESGNQNEFDQDFIRAINQSPASLELRFGHCGMLASGQHYAQLDAAIIEARKAIGSHQLLDMFEAQAASEQGDADRAERLYRQSGFVDDYSFAAAHMRHLLRTGRPAEAAQTGQTFLRGSGANFIWPLIGLAWRQCDNARWRWLERIDETVGVFDLELPDGLLDQLAHLLRRLHNSKAHPMDLSARGGTQTRLNLLERSEAEIVSLRQMIRSAVRAYIDSLPPGDATHPFLGQPRKNFRFAGSWSIRLAASGHHVGHVHPTGWISSALYIVVPDSLDHAKKEGWLAIGGAPADLGLDSPPVCHIQPKPGRLVLFPSMVWHGTEPFGKGERMTVAFDILPFAP